MSTFSVGDSASLTKTVTARDIELFTEMTGDANPVHYDQELAEQSRFGRIIVQGGVTTGLINAVVAEKLPGPGSVFINSNWNYRAPVGPGDVLTATVEVAESRSDKPLYTLNCLIINQNQETVLDGSVLVWHEKLG